MRMLLRMLSNRFDFPTCPPQVPWVYLRHCWHDPLASKSAVLYFDGSNGNHNHWLLNDCFFPCFLLRLRSTPRDSLALHTVPFTMIQPCWTTSTRSSFGKCWIISRSRAQPLLGRESSWMSVTNFFWKQIKWGWITGECDRLPQSERWRASWNWTTSSGVPFLSECQRSTKIEQTKHDETNCPTNLGMKWHGQRWIRFLEI